MANGARQFVVHEALEMIKSSFVNVSWLTPKTTVLSTPLPGAEIKTLFAPASKCAPAASLVVNRPVHSKTISMPNLGQGKFLGSRSEKQAIFCPSILILTLNLKDLDHQDISNCIILYYEKDLNINTCNII